MVDREFAVCLSVGDLVNHGLELGHAEGAGSDISYGDRITNRCNASGGQVSIVMSRGGFYGPANARARRYAAF